MKFGTMVCINILLLSEKLLLFSSNFSLTKILPNIQNMHRVNLKVFSISSNFCWISTYIEIVFWMKGIFFVESFKMNRYIKFENTRINCCNLVSEKRRACSSITSAQVAPSGVYLKLFQTGINLCDFKSKQAYRFASVHFLRKSKVPPLSLFLSLSLNHSSVC